MEIFKVSLIIPLASNDSISIELEQQISSLPKDWEILICSPKQNNVINIKNKNVRYIATKDGRANCLNEGARFSKGKYLWFLHSDSILSHGTVSKLSKIIRDNISGLYYFDLAFYPNNYRLTKLNEWGVLFRSRCLKTPFGDQGFFIKKDVFDQLGEYPTDVSYGEDHILVRKYRKSNILILPIGTKLYTSARKYETNGWLKTTINHIYLWQKQAISYDRAYRKEKKNENCGSNILQDSRNFSSKNTISIRNRHKAS